jgi:transcriptional regulator with XRE-family HTH domain
MSSVKVRQIRKREIDVPDLGDRIRAAREASKKSVTEIVRAINVSRTYWYNLENSKEDGISEDKLREIENLLNVDFGVKFND